MYYYRIYGMQLASDIALRQLPAVSAGEEFPQITVSEAPFPDTLKADSVCYSHIAADVSYLSNSHCYLLVKGGTRIFYERKKDATDALLSSYLLGWGISMLLHQQNKLAIHGSCVSGPKGAILLCGDSGSGKSTLTTALLEKGYCLMADDITMLDCSDEASVSAYAAFPYQKLCRDAVRRLGISEEELIYIDEAKDKFLVPYRGYFPTGPVPVQAMIMLSLSDTDRVFSAEVTGIAKFQACMNSLFLRPLLGEALYTPENGVRGLTLASRIPVFHIIRPVGYDTREIILKQLLTYIR